MLIKKLVLKNSKEESFIFPFQIAVSWVGGICFYFGFWRNQQFAVTFQKEIYTSSGYWFRKKIGKFWIDADGNGVNLMPSIYIFKDKVSFAFLFFQIDYRGWN